MAKKKFTVRQKISLGVGFVAVAFFILFTPVISWVNDLLKSPDRFENVVVLINVDNSLELSWDKSFDIDLDRVEVQINEEISIVDRNSLGFEKAEVSFPLNISINVFDRFGNSTEVLDTAFNEPVDDKVSVRTFNKVDDVNSLASDIFARSVIFGSILLIVSAIIFSEYLKSIKSRYLLFYGPSVLVPLAMLAGTIIVSEDIMRNQLLVGGLFSFLMSFILYFVLLTENILHVSQYRELPLAQAARASQFIFSLISMYIGLILFFSSTYPFVLKIAFISVLCFALTTTTILTLPSHRKRDVFIKSGAITLTIAFATLVLGVWPIDYVYAILGIAISYYIVLSTSLEVRQTIKQYVWVEYLILATLITILLIINASWGINGSLF